MTRSISVWRSIVISIISVRICICIIGVIVLGGRCVRIDITVIHIIRTVRVSISVSTEGCSDGSMGRMRSSRRLAPSTSTSNGIIIIVVVVIVGSDGRSKTQSR